MRIELLMVGDELLAGAIVDTNGPWLMARLFDHGAGAARKVTVPDDVSVLSKAIEEAERRGTRLLVVCGGLGPTNDDLTAEAAAKAAAVPLQRNEEARRMVEARLAAMGIHAGERQLRQAHLPVGAAALANELGTAPGFFMSIEQCEIFFLPGPPREFRPMAESHVLSWLRSAEQGEAHATTTIKAFGRGESAVADLLADVERGLEGVTIGYQFIYPEVHLRIRAAASAEQATTEACDSAARAIESALGDIVFGRDDDTLPSVVGELLSSREETLSLAESCTGGLLGALITETSGASSYLLASAVTYSNEMKTRMLGVEESLLAEHGAVSEECAAAMADGARRLSGSTHALSITGIAGPRGGTKDKPVGTVCMALASESMETLTLGRRFWGDREMVRRVSAFSALDLLRRRLLHRQPPR